MPSGKLTLIGCGTGADCLAPKALEAVKQADALAGGNRLLALFPDFKGERIIIGADASDTAKRILAIAKERKVAVLASGDPMLHGIGGTIAKLNKGAVDIEAISNVSTIQALCAKLCVPREGLRLFSMHGSEILPWRQILASKLAAIYCDAKSPATKVAADLIAVFPPAAARLGAIGADLGSERELVVKDKLSKLASVECGGLSILMLLPSDKILDDGISLGLPDSHFHCDGRMITHPELRAIAISKLKLGPGVMWDIGAGSGSVGIEASLLCRDLKVFALEKDAKRAKDIQLNMRKLGAAGFKILNGSAPESLKYLPRPRSVFIGGGGHEIKEILSCCWDALLPGGTIVAVAALLETRAALSESLPKHCKEVVSINVSRSSQLQDARLMKAENPSELFVFRKSLEEEP